MLNMIKQSLNDIGYVFLQKHNPLHTTKEIAMEIGKTFRISKALPNTNIPDIQKMVPRDKCLNLKNHYSDVFGYDRFPLHSDLAHWKLPPRYILLRCINGYSNVSTNLVLSSKIIDHFGENVFNKAIFRTRRKSQNISPALLPLLFKSSGVSGLRWDSLFLVPMNDSARDIKKLIESLDTREIMEEKLFLSEMGDTLLIDNWKILHGRSLIPSSAKNRKIERVYIENIGK